MHAKISAVWLVKSMYVVKKRMLNRIVSHGLPSEEYIE